MNLRRPTAPTAEQAHLPSSVGLRRRAAIRSCTIAFAAVLGLCALGAIAPSAQADRGIVGWIGSENPGVAAGQLSGSGSAGLAVNSTGAGGASPGDLYVSDPGNGRVDVFSSSGAFIRAFGYDIVRSGADNSSGGEAEYVLTVAATGGEVGLQFDNQHEVRIPFDASAQQLREALESFPTVGAGNVSVTGGPGDVAPYRITFSGALIGNELEVAQIQTFALEGSASLEQAAPGAGPEVCNANPPSNDVCKAGLAGLLHDDAGALTGASALAVEEAAGPSAGDLFVSALGRVNVFSATGHFIRAFGQDVVASGPDKAAPQSAVQELTVAATAGKYTLAFGGQETGELPLDAGAAEIESALTGLSSIAAGNVEVSGGPGGPYTIEFTAALADNPEPTISTISGPGNPLTGGSASVHTTIAGATGFEICEPGKGDLCQAGQPASNGGAFGDFGVDAASLAVAPAGAPNKGNLLIADPFNRRVDEYTESGEFLRAFGADVVAAGPDKTGGFEECIAAAGDACTRGSAGQALGQFAGSPFSASSPNSIAEDSSGAIYTIESGALLAENSRVQKFTPQVGHPALSPALFGTLGAPNGAGGLSEADSPVEVTIGPHGNILVSKRFPAGATPGCPDGSLSANETRIQELSPDGSTLLETAAICNGLYQWFGDAAQLAFDPTTGVTYISSEINFEGSHPYAIGQVTPPTITPESVEPNTTGATIHATIDPNGPVGHPNPPTTAYRFEYRLASESEWHQFGGEHNVGSSETSVPVTVNLGGLEGNKAYEGRFVATKQYHEGVAISTQAFTTVAVPPSIDSFSSSNLGATTALLRARVNPRGADTTCVFEYGTTTAYGHTAPCEPEDLGSAYGDQSTEAHLSGLAEGATYHFRLLATNPSGTTTSEDQSFEFLPPACPNSTIRQQTTANFLPDCRAYELVSPGNAQGTLFFPAGPNTGQATNPSRFSFVGSFSAIPGAEPIGTVGDLYVATRTDSGWVSHYIGLSGSEAPCIGGPPNEPRSHGMVENPSGFFDTIPSDPSMDHLVDWLDGPGTTCALGSNGVSDSAEGLALASNAAYLWEADGTLVDRLPTGFDGIPGATAALACHGKTNICSSDAAVSGDLTHFVFSSNQLAFTEAGLTAAPGSAYDDNLKTGEVNLISTLPGGEPIPQDPAYAKTPAGKEEFLRFPAVSTDGSHILISTATAATPECILGNSILPSCQRFIDTPVHLYMSIDDEPAIAIAAGKAVHYVAMTPDGTRVYFISEEQLTSEDKDHSTDLYMWSQQGEEEGHPLTLISKGDNAGNAGEPGNTDACGPAAAEVIEEGQPTGHEAPWTANCGVLPYSGYSYSWLPGGAGGNGIDDTAVASENGDIYFYSPEQLDGTKGIEGQQNLYDYREGKVQFVATFQPGHHCVHPYRESFGVCSDGPIVRMEVTPDDSHMALVTADRLTSYDNAGHLEMYSYTPSTGALVCDSCRPDGQPPTSDVTASQDGLFLTNDGRTFFSTEDSLVPQDTNEGEDVYEFVDGRPQLISSGTGLGTLSSNSFLGVAALPGLVAVSANGTDAYFSTFSTLTSEDHNGNFLKFYDARTNGGFPHPPPVPPCAAAEECHGPGSEAPALPTQGTAAPLTGGNVKQVSHAKHRKKKHHQKKHHKKAAVKKSTSKHNHAQANANRGGSK